MNNGLNRLSDMKREVFDVNRTEVVESRCETTVGKTDAPPIAKYLESLRKTIIRLERENSDGRRRIKELQAEIPGLRYYMPSLLAQDILLRFCRAESTELQEADLIEMCPEDRFAVHAALSELCDHKLLAVEQKCNNTFYVISTAGQNLCFSCRH